MRNSRQLPSSLLLVLENVNVVRTESSVSITCKSCVDQATSCARAISWMPLTSWLRFILLGEKTQATMLHLKRNITRAGAPVTTKGRQNKLTPPSARMLETNQHVESSQHQFLHKEAKSSFCPSTMHNNIAAQNKMRDSSRPGQPPCSRQNKIERIRPANSTQKDLSFTSFSLP